MARGSWLVTRALATGRGRHEPLRRYPRSSAAAIPLSTFVSWWLNAERWRSDVKTVNYENLGEVISGTVPSGDTVYSEWMEGVAWARQATMIVSSDVDVWVVVQVRNGALVAGIELGSVAGGGPAALAVTLCRCDSLRFGIRREESGAATVTAAVELLA